MADESHASQSADRSGEPPADEVDLLLTRLVDGEASAEDRRALAAYATRNPALWRELAERQLEMTMLNRAAEGEVQRASRVELPATPPRARQDVNTSRSQQRPGSADVLPVRRFQLSSSRALPWTGWAAAAILLIWVGVLSFAPRERADDRPVPVPAHAEFDPAQVQNAHEWLRLYLHAPYVLGELDPILLQTRELDNERIELRFVRRIEELLILDASDELPLDDQGRLKLDPERLRKSGHRGG